MPRASCIIAVMLLVATGAMAGVQALALTAAAPVHPAGCHGHPPATPFPAPVSYQCCVNGHHSAMPSAAFSQRPLVAQFAAPDDDENGSRPLIASHFLTPVIASNSPPGTAPLRI
jgi:hypothetical protein